MRYSHPLYHNRAKAQATDTSWLPLPMFFLCLAYPEIKKNEYTSAEKKKETGAVIITSLPSDHTTTHQNTKTDDVFGKIDK